MSQVWGPLQCLRYQPAAAGEGSLGEAQTGWTFDRQRTIFETIVLEQGISLKLFNQGIEDVKRIVIASYVFRLEISCC